jgi:hypothetical protein
MQTARLGMFSQGFFFQEPTNMITEGTKNVSPAYSAWVDKHVVLLIKLRQYLVPMPCSIIGETDAGVRVCIQPGWELEIRKELILAVEEATAGRETVMN